VTLNVAIIGVSIAFIDRQIIDPAYGKIATVVLFISLIVSFLGIIPYERQVTLCKPEEIKGYMEDLFKRKRLFIWFGVSLFTLGLLMLLISTYYVTSMHL
jgi:hypothetical protein